MSIIKLASSHFWENINHNYFNWFGPNLELEWIFEEFLLAYLLQLGQICLHLIGPFLQKLVRELIKKYKIKHFKINKSLHFYWIPIDYNLINFHTWLIRFRLSASSTCWWGANVFWLSAFRHFWRSNSKASVIWAVQTWKRGN
jgi:hypothetical protein